METDDNGEPASRSGICPECGRRMRTLADESLECSCGFRENGREDEEGDEGETMKIKCQKCEEVRRILVNAQWYLDLSPEAEFDRRNVESLVKKLLDIARSS